jgi:hypothetical protein
LLAARLKSTILCLDLATVVVVVGPFRSAQAADRWQRRVDSWLLSSVGQIVAAGSVREFSD